MGVSMTALFPLTFASNIFVDPQTMPSWLEAIVGSNPITHPATAVRGLTHDGRTDRLGAPEYQGYSLPFSRRSPCTRTATKHGNASKDPCVGRVRDCT